MNRTSGSFRIDDHSGLEYFELWTLVVSTACLSLLLDLVVALNVHLPRYSYETRLQRRLRAKQNYILTIKMKENVKTQSLLPKRRAVVTYKNE